MSNPYDLGELKPPVLGGKIENLESAIPNTPVVFAKPKKKIRADVPEGYRVVENWQAIPIHTYIRYINKNGKLVPGGKLMSIDAKEMHVGNYSKQKGSWVSWMVNLKDVSEIYSKADDNVVEEPPEHKTTLDHVGEGLFRGVDLVKEVDAIKKELEVLRKDINTLAKAFKMLHNKVTQVPGV